MGKHNALYCLPKNMNRGSIPERSILAKSSYDYFDSYEEQLRTGKDLLIEDIGRAFFLSAPQPVRKLMALRNRIVSIWGLKTGTMVKDEAAYLALLPMQVGDKIGLFEVMGKSENEIVIGTDDSHLNFRVSLLKDVQSTKSNRLSMTTTVLFHNAKGRLYFKVVGPFHRWVAPSMLRRMVPIVDSYQ